MISASGYEKARELFEKQIDCILRDDREAQMKLYTESLRFEFPFANDRPRLIEGREAFQTVMAPLWAEARLSGIQVTGYKVEFHATDEIDLFLAIFTLEVQASGNTVSAPFIQIIRVKDNLISAVREYSNQFAKSTAIDSHGN